MSVRGVAQILQRRLQTLYGLEEAPSVADYVTLAEPGEREQLLLRHAMTQDFVELRLVVPDCPLGDALVPSRLSDPYLQVLEGVSHFVLVAERIRIGRPTSQLELEFQAEVDKLVLIQHGLATHSTEFAARLHRQLYGEVSFLHPPESEQGARYRLANRLAARFTERLARLSPAAKQDLLRRFYRMSLGDKMHATQAA